MKASNSSVAQPRTSVAGLRQLRVTGGRGRSESICSFSAEGGWMSRNAARMEEPAQQVGLGELRHLQRAEIEVAVVEAVEQDTEIERDDVHP